MNFEYSDKSKEMQERVSAFMEEHVYPIEKEYEEWTVQNMWQAWPGMEAVVRLIQVTWRYSPSTVRLSIKKNGSSPSKLEKSDQLS